MKIILNKGQKIYFTADSHWNHVNISRGTSRWSPERGGTRDVETLEEMNKLIVDGINDNVGEDDILVHLGDWSFGGIESISEFRKLIKCKTIYLILGNHDHHIRRNKDGVADLFNRIDKLTMLTVHSPEGKETKKHRFILCHFPIASWEGMNKGIIHLHGHVHLDEDNKINHGKAMDVGVDGNFYKPYSLEEIIEIMKDRPTRRLVLPNDHHEETED